MKLLALTSVHLAPATNFYCHGDFLWRGKLILFLIIIYGKPQSMTCDIDFYASLVHIGKQVTSGQSNCPNIPCVQAFDTLPKVI